ncbi:hypothetical protein JCM19239_6035 [Vibrio variabilis]|uniref:HTH cro/C1-type domain-containing protein n=1 Tax=Vibrio variabilis TaxID=990271 RepID=A0ABQ0JLQ6_9VIBR|nr:hypothetical protein JCM19239_6035 [Vibrio variabilis]
MASNSLKSALYEKGLTITEIARRSNTSPRLASEAIKRWEGKTGTPYGATRKVLKLTERLIGKPIYTEAA